MCRCIPAVLCSCAHLAGRGEGEGVDETRGTERRGATAGAPRLGRRPIDRIEIFLQEQDRPERPLS